MRRTLHSAFQPPRRRQLAVLFLLCLTGLSGRPAWADGGPAAPPDWEKFATPKADKVVVYKSLRKLELVRGNVVLRSYHIALGRHPFGPKVEAGDGRTPEGQYMIDGRNADSEYHLALHISYPEEKDLKQASARGVEPGGSIMIHGLPSYLTPAQSRQLARDWTAGCIALTDREIDEVWRLVDDGTEVDILP